MCVQIALIQEHENQKALQLSSNKVYIKVTIKNKVSAQGYILKCLLS